MLRSLPLLLAALMSACGGQEPVALWLGGDVHLGALRTPDLKPLEPLIRGAIGIVNLEGPVAPQACKRAADRPGRSRAVSLYNTPSAIEALQRETNVRVATIANNHAADCGPEGSVETARALQKVGLLPSGGPAGVSVLSKAGRRIVIAAYDLSQGPPPNLGSELRAAAERGDLLVVTFHTTGAPSYLPTPELRDAVEIALKAGARIISAHGNHALGPVQRRGDAVIAWGLGNLLFDCDCTNETEGALLRVQFQGQAISAQIIPIEAGLRGAAARPAQSPTLMFELFAALGSSRLLRDGAAARF